MKFSEKLKASLIAIAVIFVAQARASLDAKDSISDATAREVLTLALRNLHSAICSKGRHCAQVTEKELESPPISIEDARKIMTIGLVSGFAEKCGVDWDKNFFAPLMRHYRYQVRMNERQLALIALIHGIQQSRAFKSTTDDMCTDDIKKSLSNSVAR